MVIEQKYVGCYPCEDACDTLSNSGLSPAMISLAGDKVNGPTAAGVYLASNSKMTTEKCIALCLLNGYFLAGLYGWNG